MSGALQVNHLFAEITEPSPPKANLWLILGLCLQTLICAVESMKTNKEEERREERRSREEERGE